MHACDFLGESLGRVVWVVEISQATYVLRRLAWCDSCARTMEARRTRSRVLSLAALGIGWRPGFPHQPRSATPSAPLARSPEGCRSAPRCWCRVPAPRSRPDPTGVVASCLAGDAPTQEDRYSAGDRVTQWPAPARLEVRGRSARPGCSRRRRADILLRGARIAVFLDGCFWHSCPSTATCPRPTPTGGV